jgi:hypothetical protein
LAAGAVLPATALLLAACPSLDELRVGSGDAATEHRAPPPSDAAAPKEEEAAIPCHADAEWDPKNCGSCGHDCLGGACTEGVCQPVVLYTGDTPVSIVVDGPTLYVAVQTVLVNAGYVFRCTTADCMASMTVLASGELEPWVAVKQDGGIYWANLGGSNTAIDPGSVMGCRANACPEAGPTSYTPDGGGMEGGINVGGLAADETYLYWSETFGPGSDHSAIYSCVPSECAATRATLQPGFGFVFALTLDSNYLYWIAAGPNEVHRCELPSCGGSPQIVAYIPAPTDKTVGLSGIALYGENAYWTDGLDDGGTVYGCPSSGCPPSGPSIVAKDQSDPALIAADDSGVYWANTGDGTIRRCSLQGCTEAAVIARTYAPFAVALDAVSVYFTSSSGIGSVLRVAK